jgi:NAD(P) transhydrogenase subunit alpha
MILVALKEQKENEKRTSLTPQIVKKYKDMGLSVYIEKGVGEGAGFQDELYFEQGAEIATEEVIKESTFVLCATPPSEKNIKKIKENAFLIGQLKPLENDKILKTLSIKKINAFSMEFLPRISRAQSMDVLSSQANLAGYRSVIEAAYYFKRAFPLMMTAAGTIPAAKVLILGVGVAGLQAIATAKRLGAIVSAYDVRPSTKEQVKSLGATFIEVESFESGDGQGGYAKEMSEDYKKAQEERLNAVIKTQDIVITTAQIPGKPAPLLVTEEMVKSMKPGSVIIDLAVESGGNCALSKNGENVDCYGVKIVGPTNILSSIAYDASELYAKNIYTFIKALFKKEGDVFLPDWEDELVVGTLLTRDGSIVHPRFKIEDKIL